MGVRKVIINGDSEVTVVMNTEQGPPGGGGAILYTGPQALTAPQKQQARNNMEVPSTAEFAGLSHTVDTNRGELTDYVDSETNAAISTVRGGTTTEFDTLKKLHDMIEAMPIVSNATVNAPGLVKPDGETITIDPDGTIHAAAQSANTVNGVFRTEYSSSIFTDSQTDSAGNYIISPTGRGISLDARLSYRLVNDFIESTIPLVLTEADSGKIIIFLNAGGGILTLPGSPKDGFFVDVFVSTYDVGAIVRNIQPIFASRFENQFDCSSSSKLTFATAGSCRLLFKYRWYMMNDVGTINFTA